MGTFNTSTRYGAWISGVWAGVSLCGFVYAESLLPESNNPPTSFQRSLSLGFGSHYQRSTLLTDYWLNSAGDFGADVIELRYLRRNMWRGVAIGIGFGLMDSDATDNNIITTGDSSKLELTANYIGPEAMIEHRWDARKSVYGRAALYAYNVRPDYRYTSGSISLRADDSKRGIGGSMAVGSEYRLSVSSDKIDSVLVDYQVGLFVEAGYRYAHFKDLDEALTGEFNRQFSAALIPHDHSIEGWNVLVGVNVNY